MAAALGSLTCIENFLFRTDRDEDYGDVAGAKGSGEVLRSTVSLGNDRLLYGLILRHYLFAYNFFDEVKCCLPLFCRCLFFEFGLRCLGDDLTAACLGELRVSGRSLSNA